jgi:hypothetical protein
MFKKKKISLSDPEFTKRFNALMDDPEYRAKMAKRNSDFENMVNTPMRWYHKLPYWIVLGLICYGLAKLFGVV